MRKLTFLFACLLLTVPCAKGTDANLVQLVKEIRPAVATVLTYDNEKQQLGQGSGFFINKEGHLITNYHVLKGAYSAEVKTFDNKKYPVKLVLAENEGADLIKVSIDIPEKAVQFVQVANTQTAGTISEVAERVFVIGSPMGLEQTVSEGIVSAVKYIPTIGKIFQISAPISTASSGSPVVNMKGRIIGVASFLSIENQKLYFAVSGEQVPTLKSEKNKKTLIEWTLGVSTKEMNLGRNVYTQGLKFLWAAEYEKALDHFKKVIEVNRHFVEVWFFVGYCYHELGRYQEKIEALKKAISIKPDYAEAYCSLGVTYCRLGRYQESIEALKNAIRIKPDFAIAHYGLGVTYGILSCYLEEIEACKQAIRINPDYTDAYYGLGSAYGELGRYQESIEALMQAISINPDFAEAHYCLGVVYNRLGQYQDAIEAYKQTIRIKPDDSDAHYNLGMAYLIMGDKGSTIEEYKILKTLDKEKAGKLFNFIYE